MKEGYQLQLQLCKAYQKRSRNLQYHPSAKGGYEQLPGADTLRNALFVFVCAKLKEGWQVFANLPGWCWARIKQLALIGSSSSLHSEACKALGGSDGVVHSTISLAAICIRAVAKDSAVTVARGDRRATCTSSGHSLHGLAPLRPHTAQPDSPQAEHHPPPALLEHLCHAGWRRSISAQRAI